MSRTAPIHVAAFGALHALGDTHTGFSRLLAGESGFGPGPAWADGCPVAPVASLPAPLDRTHALATRLLAPLDLDPEGLILIVATTTAAQDRCESDMMAAARGQTPASPENVTWRSLLHHAGERLARTLGVSVPGYVISTACTSGTVAIGLAADLVRAGRFRRALVLGADGLCQTTVQGFRSLGAYTQTRCRPFDEARDGMAIGEAAAWLLLEPGQGEFELLGVGTTTDGRSLTAPDPEGAGLVRAIREALGDLPGEAVDHVNAHATGTPHNDAAEAAALGIATPNAAVSATKGATGHTLGAAGLLEAVFLLQSMRAGLIPPVLGLNAPILGVDVETVARARIQHIGISVNLAFGGHNAAVAFRRHA